MTLRVKTIEYGFPISIVSVASGVARTMTAVSVYVPETSSRTIRSAILEFSVSDNQTSAASITSVVMGVQISSVAISNVTVSQTIVNSGENQSFVFTRDATAYFAANFTGSVHTVTPVLTVTGNATINCSCKLILTYEYEDSVATTRIKTVKIPFDGNTGSLTTTAVNLGGLASQIPLLAFFLPEASKVFRSVFIEVIGHTGTTAAGAAVRTIGAYSNSYVNGSHANTLASDVFFREIYEITSTAWNAPNSTYTVTAKTSSATASPASCLTAHMVITYEYNHSASTRIMNSIQLSVMDESGWIGGTTTADKSRFTREINIQEPGSITLMQSGILATFIDSGAVTLDFRVGSQPSRVFSIPATVRCGSLAIMRRIDSGAVGGAGITLNRGFTTLVMDWFSTSATAGNLGSNMSGLLMLNYLSDKHPEGDGAHSSTTSWIIRPYTTGNLVQRLQAVAATVPVIPETNYWVAGVGYTITQMPSGTVSANLGYSMQVEVQSTEAEGAGWRPMYNAIYASDAEIGPSIMFARARTEFKRWPADSDSSRLDIELPRSYRYDVNVNASQVWQTYMFLTTHSIYYNVAGTISGSSGGTVEISAYRVYDGLLLGSTSRVGNGTFSIPWYDNTDPIFVRAYESSTLKGVSVQQVADAGNFDINVSTSGGSTYYAY